MKRASQSRLHRGFVLLALALGLAGLAGESHAAPPVLTVPGSQTVSESQQLLFTISATDPDGQIVVLRASGLPLGSTFTDNQDNTGLFSWTPDFDQAGPYNVAFMADDTFGGTDFGAVAIEVLDANSPPVLTSIGDRTVERGTQLFVSLSGYDPEGSPLSYRAEGLPSYGTLTDYGDGSGYLYFSPGSSTPVGTSTMTVYLSDGTDEVSETFNVTVTASASQSPPVLASIGNQLVMEGSSSSVTLSGSDSDGDPLTWTVSLPAFADLTVTGSSPGSSTARLDIQPGFCDAGSYTAYVTLSDGTFTDGENFSIVVADLNRAPAWQGSPSTLALTLPEGTSSSLAVSAADPDQVCGGPAPALSVAGSNAGTQLTLSLTDAGDGGGTLHVTAGASAAGSYQVTLRATDRADAQVHQDAVVAVTVSPVDDPPAAVAARAWSESNPVRLIIGKPRHWFYLEPLQGSFALGSVVLSSVRLTVDQGDNTGAGIAPLLDRMTLGSDRDQNGVAELHMEFSKEDLSALFAECGAIVDVPMLLSANLSNGDKVVATLSLGAITEKLNVIRKLGPNPLNPEAVLTVRMAQDGFLKVRVFDLRGRLVRTLMDSPSVPAGDLDLRFDGRDDGGRNLSSGRYFVRVDVAAGKDASAITILK